MRHAILGARGSIQDPEAALGKIREWGQTHHAEVLAMDARSVFGRDHLESAVTHAERAQAQGAMGARTLAAETLLYASGQRQIVDAIRVAGLRKGTETVALIAWTADDPEDLLKSLGWVRDDRVLDARGKSLEMLGVNELERGTVPEEEAADLALEKVALLDVLR